MILIFSDYNDPSTNEVINWLRFSNTAFVRINPDQHCSIKLFNLSNSNGLDWTIEVNNRLINYSEIKSVWYRRGTLKIDASKIKLVAHSEFKQYLSRELEVIEEIIVFSILQKPIIGNFYGTVNKLKVLATAQSIGIKIPETSIVSDKKSVEKLEKNSKLITKPIFEIIPFRDKLNSMTISAYTTSISSKEINDYFNYSLIQSEVKKDFEIRVFYFNKRFYSSAIFSQKNSKTQIDFRKYDDETPNRVIPFILPKKIENQLEQLMKILDLNTGSFDLIYSNEEYYFLEVNPVGQFGMVGQPCNYQLEKALANTLNS